MRLAFQVGLSFAAQRCGWHDCCNSVDAAKLRAGACAHKVEEELVKMARKCLFGRLSTGAPVQV